MLPDRGNGWVFEGHVPPCVVMRKCITTPVAVRSTVWATRSSAAVNSSSLMKPFSMTTLPSWAYMNPAPWGFEYHMVSMVSAFGRAMPAGFAAIMHIVFSSLYVCM